MSHSDPPERIIIPLQPSAAPIRRGVDLIGQFFFGLMALVCSIAFGGFAFLLFNWGQKAQGWQNILLREFLIHVFGFVSLFMLLVTASFWSAGNTRLRKALEARLPKAFLLIMLFAFTVMTIGLLRG